MDRTFKRERPIVPKRRSKRTVATEAYEDLEIGGIRKELQRVRYNQRFWTILCTIAGGILVAAAIVVLVTDRWLPVVKIMDDQMSPVYTQGQRAVAKQADQYRRGDIIAFHSNRNILVRRIIACENDWVNIAADGTVFVNDIAIEEPYVSERLRGDCSVVLPCKVPKGSFFVMSDNRGEAQDSRDASIGCVSEGQIIGRLR